MLRDYEKWTTFRLGAFQTLSFLGRETLPCYQQYNCKMVESLIKNGGIVTAIFQAHSSASKAVFSGVTVADILSTAVWSSEVTFQCIFL